jgi:hypothetical protein
MPSFSALALSRSWASNTRGAILKTTTLMKLKPWRGKLRQNMHRFNSVISLSEPRRINAAYYSGAALCSSSGSFGDVHSKRPSPRRSLGDCCQGPRSVCEYGAELLPCALADLKRCGPSRAMGASFYLSRSPLATLPLRPLGQFPTKLLSAPALAAPLATADRVASLRFRYYRPSRCCARFESVPTGYAQLV